MQTLRPMAAARRAYCAGPLFNEAERQEMLQIATSLRSAGFDAFVPHDDGMEFSLVRPHLVEQGYEAADVGCWIHEAIFALDVYQVARGCGPLVFNMNGRVPDEGAVAECAIAWTLGKPVVLYKEDVRSMIVGRDNPLLVGMTGFRTVTEMDEIAPALEDALEACELAADDDVTCPANLRQPLDAGGRLWEALRRQDAAHNIPVIADLVLKLFGPQSTVAK